jgi:hypothetical protein
MSITKKEEDYRKWKDHLIGKDTDYVCTIPQCNKVWYPTIEKDVNRKRLSCFYKLCSSCRLKSYNKAIEYKEKMKKLNMKKVEEADLDA